MFKISEKIADDRINKNIEGTPLGFFHHQKISDRIVEVLNIEREKKSKQGKN